MTPAPTRPTISTFIKSLRPLVLLCLLACAARAEETASPASDYESSLASARSAIERDNTPAADFWLSRCLGLSASSGGGLDPRTLEGLIEERRIPPAAFLSGRYDPEFLDWFASSTHARWAPDRGRIRERYGSVEVAQASSDDYAVTVVAYPELQAWYPASEAGGEGRRLLVAMISGSHRRAPFLIAGKRISGKVYSYWPAARIETRGRAIQKLWTPEFHDADGDGLPELWLRFNQALGNGFVQKLLIYRIQDQNGPRLWRTFEGKRDGAVRRLEDGSVEVAHGRASSGRLSRFELDRYQYETWQFKDKEFVKTSEREGEIPLRSGAWKDIYRPLN